MRRFTSARPSPAMVVAFIALLAALSGTATALQGKNTVDSGDIKNGVVKSEDIKNGGAASKDIKNGGVTTDDLKNNNVRGDDVRNNALTGTDIKESALGKVPSAKSVDSFQPYSKVATATPGANFDAARAAAPAIALAERGALAIYGKCFESLDSDTVWSFTYIRTSVNGSVLDSPSSSYSGNPFLDIATPEDDRVLNSSSEANPGSSSYSATFSDWQAMAPGGSAVMGSAGTGVKKGDLPGGNGVYGAGDACLFSGYIAG